MKRTIVALSAVVLSINGLAQNKENEIDGVNLQGRILSVPYNDGNENVRGKT